VAAPPPTQVPSVVTALVQEEFSKRLLQLLMSVCRFVALQSVRFSGPVVPVGHVPFDAFGVAAAPFEHIHV
jgi:hypothetical protein